MGHSFFNKKTTSEITFQILVFIGVMTLINLYAFKENQQKTYVAVTVIEASQESCLTELKETLQQEISQSKWANYLQLAIEDNVLYLMPKQAETAAFSTNTYQFLMPYIQQDTCNTYTVFVYDKQ
ncbi:hypothetical protein SAMN05216480_11442 [Pustulibacterium marinum]|uniref:Uncharacterized protein n=1 Tax=Pustulibacterium marinum TaxID=1224947 RepID=A0A1I7IAP7_9FLAO|nr:hypothetical protein [Pustulibacterium marinum]SFU70001.1 hypothetical protein SAMN05216480_11442 [Pustulibacterium marinum]